MLDDNHRIAHTSTWPVLDPINKRLWSRNLDSFNSCRWLAQPVHQCERWLAASPKAGRALGPRHGLPGGVRACCRSCCQDKGSCSWKAPVMFLIHEHCNMGFSLLVTSCHNLPLQFNPFTFPVLGVYYVDSTLTLGLKTIWRIETVFQTIFAEVTLWKRSENGLKSTLCNMW